MGSTHELLSKLFFLSSAEVDGIPGVAVECVDTVSYTHLDVYKRQLYGTLTHFTERLQGTAKNVQFFTQTIRQHGRYRLNSAVQSVSYTHLDVYKRQLDSLIDSVDGVQLNVVISNVLLISSVQMLVQLLICLLYTSRCV